MAKRSVLLIGLLAVAFFQLRQIFIASPKSQVEITKEATATAQITAGEVAKVAFVIDGDTIELTDGRRVRYIGIDAPETAHEGKPAECFSEESRDENRKHVEGKTVKLEKDVSEKDSYGRLLRYVFIGETLINKQLVRGGFARAWNVPPDERYASLLLTSQNEAKGEGHGVWKFCSRF